MDLIVFGSAITYIAAFLIALFWLTKRGVGIEKYIVSIACMISGARLYDLVTHYLFVNAIGNLQGYCLDKPQCANLHRIYSMSYVIGPIPDNRCIVDNFNAFRLLQDDEIKQRVHNCFHRSFSTFCSLVLYGLSPILESGMVPAAYPSNKHSPKQHGEHKDVGGDNGAFDEISLPTTRFALLGNRSQRSSHGFFGKKA